MALLLVKCHFGKGPRKGLCRNKRVQVEKTKIYQCQHAKRCFSWFFFFCGFAFFSLCFCSFVCKKAQKRLFSCSFGGFFYFVPPKGLSLKAFFFLFCLFPVFLSSSLSKFHLSLLFAIIDSPPFGKHFYVFGFFCLAFTCPLLMFACLF